MCFIFSIFLAKNIKSDNRIYILVKKNIENDLANIWKLS